LLGFAQPNDGNLPDPSEVWDVNSGQKLFNLGPIVRHSSTVLGITFSPDRSRVATANAAGTAVIWDTATGQPLLMLPGHTSYVQDVVFGPDGRHLASVNQDGSAQIWDVATGQELLALMSSPAQLSRVAYSPDGRHLITAGSDAIRVHVLPIDDLVSLARSRLTRWWTDEECHKLLHREQCGTQSR
jgi:WD40 repeat protein